MKNSSHHCIIITKNILSAFMIIILFYISHDNKKHLLYIEDPKRYNITDILIHIQYILRIII